MSNEAYFFYPLNEIIVMDDREAKTPNGSDWQFVDIFLFSNGQRQTPPRKYHLDTEDLSSWPKTLMTLAHSQYGNIFSSVDLYTTEGQRVLTPMEVSHGGTYVAVPPQDTFIPAGYDDYLMKASRSREKRQSRKFSGLGLQSVGEIESKRDNSETKSKEENELNILNEEKEITATPTSIDPLKIISKLQPQHKNRDSIKPSENKTPIRKNPQLVKKSSLLLSQQTLRRTSFRNKDSVPKKNLKVNTLSGINSKSTIVGNSTNVIRSKYKTFTKINRNPNGEKASAVLIEGSKTEVNEQLNRIMSSREKNTSTESAVLLNVMDDKELIVVKNNDSEINPVSLERDKNGSVFTRQTSITSTMPLIEEPIEENKSPINKDEATLTVINNIIENVFTPDVAITKETISKNENQSEIVDVALPPVSKGDKAMLSNKLPVDGLVAVIDNGDVVNLNLKIEVRKADGITDAKCEKNPVQLHCLTEKCSQVNVDQVFVEASAKECHPSDKPITEKINSRIVVMHDCACCSYFNDLLHKIDTAGVSLEDKKYVLLLPSPHFGINVERFQCDQEINTEPHQNRASVENPVKKVYGTTSLQVLESIVKNDVILTSEVTNTITEKDDVIDYLIADPKVSASHIERTSSKKLSSDHRLIFTTEETQETQETGSEALLIRKSIVHIPKVTVDNSSQTEWFSLLLEARLHEDGRYSFHLPPLHVLKYYGF